MPSDRSLHAVILAGGSGQRFWPLSRELSPKQMLSVFGTESLICQAIHRIMPFTVDGGEVTIVTGERLFDELRNHLTAQDDPDLRSVRYIQEPLARNTAPAIALAAAVIEAGDPAGVMAVLPSDHMLDDGQAWIDCIEAAARAARDRYLVTLGIRPTRPETGYGYIKAAEALPDFDSGTAKPHRVERFVEKPDVETAQRYVESGEYYWNAGIFVMRADTLLDELVSSGPDGARIAETARWFAALPEAARNGDEARERFASLPSVSIDTAVMERSGRVAVVPADLRWSDVGSLLALEGISEPDRNGNVRVGRGVDIDTHDSIVYSTDRVIATLGMKDALVVDTSDATLVLPKDRAQDVRLVFEALKALGAPEVVQPKVSLRPWGSWRSLLRGEGYHIKLIQVKPGTRLSLQRHEHRSEHWVVVCGTAHVTRDGEVLEVRSNESAFIPIRSVHRLENRGPDPLEVIEVQVGKYLDEDDIVRLDDDWARGSA